MALVVIGALAEKDIERIDAWWSENRSSSPGLFREELDEAIAQLAAMPESGPSYLPRRFPRMRRMLLRATRFHVYYEFDGDRVYIVTVWSAVRGRGPKLG